MGHGHDRFHPVGDDTVKQPVVIGQPLLVGLGVVSVREYSGPVDGGSEGVQPQAVLSQQLHILLIGVVEVDPIPFWEDLLRIRGQSLLQIRSGDGGYVHSLLPGKISPVLVDIGGVDSLSALVPRPLHLAGGKATAPKEGVWDLLCKLAHDINLQLMFCYASALGSL